MEVSSTCYCCHIVCDELFIAGNLAGIANLQYRLVIIISNCCMFRNNIVNLVVLC